MSTRAGLQSRGPTGEAGEGERTREAPGVCHLQANFGFEALIWSNVSPFFADLSKVYAKKYRTLWLFSELRALRPLGFMGRNSYPFLADLRARCGQSCILGGNRS